MTTTDGDILTQLLRIANREVTLTYFGDIRANDLRRSKVSERRGKCELSSRDPRTQGPGLIPLIIKLLQDPAARLVREDVSKLKARAIPVFEASSNNRCNLWLETSIREHRANNFRRF